MTTNNSNECPGFGDNLKAIVALMFLKRNETADFHLQCDGKRIPCQNMILAASSLVFKSMIESTMRETEAEMIEISNFLFETRISRKRSKLNKFLDK